MEKQTETVLFGVNSYFAVRHFLLDLVAAARRQGFKAVVAAPGPEDGNAQVDGFEFRPISLEREISLFADLRALWQLCCLLRSIRPAITDMSTPKMALLGGLAAWLTRVPHRIYTLRGLRYQTASFWMRILLKTCERIACACAHQVICSSRSLRDAALSDGIAPASKLKVLGDRISEGVEIRNTPDSMPSDIDGLRRRLGLPKGALVIGYVGRLVKDKGVHELAECFQILRDGGLPVRLLLIGDFEPGDPVDEGVADWIRKDPDVHWLGYVPDPQIYYGLMDVFVFPTHREGLGRVLLEAAAAGKPVVSTRTTGVVDVVLEELTGLLVPAGDSAALAQATGRLLRDPALAARMGQAARHLVREHFDNAVYLERFGMVLQSLSRGEPSPAFQEP